MMHNAAACLSTCDLASDRLRDGQQDGHQYKRSHRQSVQTACSYIVVAPQLLKVAH